MGGLVLSQPWGRNVSQTQCKTQSIPCALSSRQKGGMGAGCCSWWQLNPLPACLCFAGPFIQPPGAWVLTHQTVLWMMAQPGHASLPLFYNGLC